MLGRRRQPAPSERPQLDLDFAPPAARLEGLSRREAGRQSRDDQRGVDDAGLFQMLGVLVAVSALVVALALPQSPLRVVNRDSGGRSLGDSIAARGDMPSLPAGYAAVSRFFELDATGREGAQTIEISLRTSVPDGERIAFFTHEDGAWKRLAPASLSGDGKRAVGEVPYAPRSVVVLRSEVDVRPLALIVEAGQSPDSRALPGASMVAVRGASLRASASLTTPGALEAARQAAGGKPVHLVVSAGAEGVASMGLLGPDPVGAIAEGAKAHGAAGVVMDLGALPSEQRPALTQFARDLAARMRSDGMGLRWAVPVGRDGVAYDWKSLIDAGDGIWLVPRVDPASYYADIEAALADARAGGVDLSRVTLVLDRRSQEVGPEGRTALSRHEALALASTIQRQASPPGTTLQVSAPFLGASGGGMRWDESARAVSFAFVDGSETHRVWVENRFSAGFRLDLAHRAGLGGVAVDQALASDVLADVWEVVLPFAEGVAPTLARPHGKYLVPCWQSMGGGTFEGAGECWRQDAPTPTALWRAPANAGSYTIRLVVSDGVAFVGQEISVRVSQGGRVEPADGAARPGDRPERVGTSNAAGSRTAGRTVD